jgi:hypothetical protein
MPRTGWTPSIVPEGDGDDQNVYIVVDDFGRNGRAYRETDVETADLETVILGLSRSASLPSTPPKAGRRTHRRTSPKSCAAAATCKCGTYHRAFRTS